MFFDVNINQNLNERNIRGLSVVLTNDPCPWFMVDGEICYPGDFDWLMLNDGFYAAFSSSILNKNILARISLQGTTFDSFTKDNFSLTTASREYFGPVDIQKLKIQLLDEYGRVLNLNNMDYSFCLTFKTIYNL